MDEKLEHYKRYGWTCSEDNLKTLPEDAPEGAKKLTEWLTLEGRRRSIVEWTNAQSEDNKIHGKFWHIGAWTHRMSHSNPNQANIFSVWPDDREAETPIEKVKKEYDGALRACWTASPGCMLVGTDADAIQLRILTHYMQSKDYSEAILNGDKSIGTDIHNLNKDALGPICKSRDDSKRFIYSWLLGAGIPKIASILGCSTSAAKGAVSNFLDSIPELKRLKGVRIPRDAKRGYFVGLDGRRVKCSSEHLMLAGYLQAGEAVVMKHANVLWRKALVEDHPEIAWRQIDFVHDEWVTEVEGGELETYIVGDYQRWAIEKTGEDLGLWMPLSGSTKVGKTWKDVH